ncbi:hypothetical protein [Shewanella fidelis]|uniref:Uncharacterized protein n=1 Tax=Shewanella fidelis TaxID=173509 RepID=A0AAW8NLA7_9GAMM|nr:hypothetical protein [Shewanella fidelis]MDR8523482.1 hypothetical protein [Shewanella fidelis]MDW4813285.1 hypothetical protein [Shewanella fidelis]MDW4817343.1 hypothetical protein [Shewanella fidelis]MDW4821301.1 hypothetical protein [Shewanella fidelis]MDW4824621.1 hypothetical protein [Shewanella fidelis]
MSSPVTVYRWDDAGAPQLTSRTPSEIIDIMRKCLIEGYGAKQPLGWTVEFEDVTANEIVFRNKIADGGSGGYVKFLPRNGNNASGSILDMKSAMSMSDINTAHNQGYRSSIIAQVTTAVHWVLIGTSRSFYFIIRNNSAMGARRNYGENMCYVGDFAPYSPTDQCIFIATGTPDFGGDFTPTSMQAYSYTFNRVFSKRSTLAASKNALRLASIDGDGVMADYGFADGQHTFEEYARGATADRKGLYVPVSIMSKYSLNDYARNDPEGNPIPYSVRYPWARGELAGIVTEVIHRHEALPFSSWPLIESHLGHDHWAISGNGVSISTWINMVEWDYYG